MVSLLRSQPFTWGLRLQEQGVHTGALGANFENYPQSHYKEYIYHFEFSSERAPRITKKFRFLTNLLINFRSDRESTVHGSGQPYI